MTRHKFTAEAVLDSMPYDILLVDSSHTIQFANRKAMESFRMPREHLIGKYCPKLVHGCGEPIGTCPLEEAASSGQRVQNEVYDPRSKRWLLSSAYPMADRLPDGKKLFVHVVRDITDKKLAEVKADSASSALVDRQEKDRFIRTTSTKIVHIKPAHIDEGFNEVLRIIGEHSRVDRSYVFLFDIRKEKMSNTHEWCAGGIEPQMHNLQDVPAEAVPWWMQKLRNHETIHIPRVADLPAEASNEKEILQAQDIQSLLVVPMISDDDIIGFMGFDSVRKEKVWGNDDIVFLQMVSALLTKTLAQKEYEEILRERNNQLRMAQKMESLGRLAGGVTHDFNNILTIVIGYSELLKAHLDGNDSQLKLVEEIRKAGKMGSSLTRQLLAFSRRQIIEPVVLDLNEVVGNIEKILRHALGEDIHLDISYSPSPLSIFSDPGQLEQVMMNIALNAKDAMPGGGTLSVAAGSIELGENFCRQNPVAKQGKFVTLIIRDTGVGMDEETQSKIFDPFFTTKGEGKGTGLGLSTVFGIVKQNNGYLDVTSSPGTGTKFVIYFPQVETHPGERRKTGGFRRTEGQSGTILVVEDQEAVRHLVCRILGANGYTILQASNGKEAVDLVEEHEDRIDLILTDVVMPEMNGKQLADYLHERRPGLKFIFMSGNVKTASFPKGLMETNAQVVSKPFSLNKLLDTVREVLNEP
jgi:PAS domain S-box-containing protein